MHNASEVTHINCCRNCAEGVWWLVILGLTFDSKMTFEKHLRSVSSAASLRLDVLMKFWQVLNDRLLLGRCFWGFVRHVFEYCSAVWCLAANTHLKLLDCIVSGASFLTEGVFECYLAHRRSMVLCMLYKIRCNPMHPLYGALPELYVPVHVTCSAVIAHRYTYAPCCRTSQLRSTLFPYQYLCSTILVTLYSMVWDWLVSRAGPMPLFWPS